MSSFEPPAGLWEQLVEHSPNACAVLDVEMRYMAWSKSWVTDHRLSDQELKGRSHYEVFAGIPERRKELYRRCLAGEILSSDHDRFERADRRADHVRWRMSPWRDTRGEIGGVLMYTQVINAEVEARRQLESQSQFQQALFENSPIGLNLCRMDGTWVESNPAFLALLGYSAEEADGKLTYWELTPRRYDEQEALQIERLTTTGRYGPYEKEFIRKDGSLVPVRLNGFLIERDGERYIWSLIEDITHLKALEAEYEQERLKSIQASKLAMLGEMAAGIAHEINNPLTIVSGYLELLAQHPDPAGLLPEALTAMSKATERAARIVEGLRKFARDDVGGPLERVVISEVVTETLAVCAERFRSHGVDLRLDLACREQALCRPNELSQVLLNLLTNALHAVEGEAEPWIELSVAARERAVELRVVDSGPGIPADLQERIFEPFFTTKAVGKGTGLGLSISKGIVEGVGGRLQLCQGSDTTSFVVELPCEEASDG